MNESKFSPSMIIGIALIISSLVFGIFYYSSQSINNKNILSVVGSVKKQVTSDKAKLIISINRIATTDELSQGYKDISHDFNLAKELLKKFGIDNDNLISSPISMNQMYDQNSNNQVRYQLAQTITIQSDDVNKITEISKKIPELAAQGAIISVQSLEYYYSKLPDLRVSLLTQAVQDAKARAEKIAQGTGQSVGSVQSASSGVVQVLQSNSVDISDYGNYDTSSIEKDIMVTVKVSFRLN